MDHWERSREITKRQAEDAVSTPDWIGQKSTYIPMTDEMRAKCEKMRRQHIEACFRAMGFIEDKTFDESGFPI